jgi:cytochrome oxidase assembly protein ShyY1
MILRKRVLAYLAALVFFAVFFQAGLWQYRRALEKTRMLEQFALLSETKPVAWKQALPAAQNSLQHVEVHGRYLQDRNILVDNQRIGTNVGVMVLTPFQASDSDSLLLVARGVLPLEHGRSALPNPRAPSGMQSLRGLLGPPMSTGIKIGDNRFGAPPWWIASLDVDELQAQLGQAVLPLVFRLSADQPHGFAREWKPATLPPERHCGYALQWFGLALTVLVTTLLLSFRKRA